MNNTIYIMLNDKSIAVALDILEEIHNQICTIRLSHMNWDAHKIVKYSVNHLGYGLFGIYMKNDCYALENLTFIQIDLLIHKLKVDYYGSYQKPLKSVPHFDFRGV